MPITPYAYEGKTRMWYLPAVADATAPTVSEFTAGTEITSQSTADGVTPNHTENFVATGMLSGFIRNSIGTEGVTFNLRFLRNFDAGGDQAWALFDTRGKIGLLAIINDGADPAASGEAELYPAEFGRRKRVQSGANTHQAFSVQVAVNSDFTDDAIIAI